MPERPKPCESLRQPGCFRLRLVRLGGRHPRQAESEDCGDGEQAGGSTGHGAGAEDSYRCSARSSAEQETAVVDRAPRRRGSCQLLRRFCERGEQRVAGKRRAATTRPTAAAPERSNA